MATEPATVLPSFPLPPPFFKFYADDTDGTRPLPPDPPPPPVGSFLVFGQPFDPEEPLVPPLQGRRLYEQGPDGAIDAKASLTALNAELMFVYAELLRVLVENPTTYPSPLNTMNQVLNSMQHLINVLRPVQARASLEYALQLQTQEKRDAISSLRVQMEAVDKAVQAAAMDLQQQCSAAGSTAAGGIAVPEDGADAMCE